MSHTDHWMRTASALATMLGALTIDPHAGADVNDLELHGVFTTFSDGQNARTNDRFHDEASVTSTWVVDSRCQDFLDCTGQVRSDLGWIADLKYDDGIWRATHVVEGWEHCEDGSVVAGEQAFSFHRDPANVSRFVGFDKTIGPSGACGKNAWLSIEMPFTVTPRS